jgi:glycosyltransferase involved in cell wall biosynthesis
MNYNTFSDLFEEKSPETDYWTLAELHGHTFDKRVMFLISDQHLIPHGGIGQFAKSFSELCLRLKWKCDIVTDKKPRHEFVNSFVGTDVIYTDNPHSYNQHTSTFMYTEGINFEKIANFENSVRKATKLYNYDLIVCNTQESMPAVLGLQNVVFYTHLYSTIFRTQENSKFLPTFHQFFNKMLEMPNVIVGTQSVMNKTSLDRYVNDCRVLPMPMPERDLLYKNNNVNREGVLYIGRYEQGKRPDLFLKFCLEANLPVRVLTNKKGKIKFENECNKLGITDYVIKAELVGQEKVDFIKSCKLHLNCSKLESYCFAVFECIGHMPCVVLDDQNWSNNFEHVIVVNKKNMVSTLRELYDTVDIFGYDYTSYTNILDNQCEIMWKSLL